MSGVWVFKNGVLRSLPPEEPGVAAGPSNKKALVYAPASETRRLLELGWERCGDDPGDTSLLLFRRGDSAELISLPADFASVGADHMHNIVVKNPEQIDSRSSTTYACTSRSSTPPAVRQIDS
uniref:Uncharacterized protein n=1 Tax=Setaria viridis TaxID=4556 RepID=A0A4U6TGP8_SETVI|nr:hypothetical protein SEVIR_8G094600v2 [Setaria viridis]